MGGKLEEACCTPTETPLPLGWSWGPAFPDCCQAGVKKLRMHRMSSGCTGISPCSVSPAELTSNTSPQAYMGQRGSGLIRHPWSYISPVVCVYLNPPSSKLCCIKRGAPGDTREPVAIWRPAAAELSQQATAQTAHPESDVITNLVCRELFLLAV